MKDFQRDQLGTKHSNNPPIYTLYIINFNFNIRGSHSQPREVIGG